MNRVTVVLATVLLASCSPQKSNTASAKTGPRIVATEVQHHSWAEDEAETCFLLFETWDSAQNLRKAIKEYEYTGGSSKNLDSVKSDLDKEAPELKRQIAECETPDSPPASKPPA
jgi:hypothetical protein